METTNIETLESGFMPDIKDTMEAYKAILMDLIEYCNELKQKANILTNNYEGELRDIELNISNILRQVEDNAQDEREQERLNTAVLLEELDYYEAMQLRQGNYSEERKIGLANLRAAVETAQQAKLDAINQLIGVNKEQLEKAPQEAIEQLDEEFEADKSIILHRLEEKTQNLALREKEIFNQHYETACNLYMINKIEPTVRPALSCLNIGTFVYDPLLFDEPRPTSFYHLISFFHKKNLVLRHTNANTERIAEGINCVLARALMSFKPGQLYIHLIDPVKKGLNFRQFSSLTPEVKTIYTEEQDIEDLFVKLDRIITTNVQLLGSDYQDLGAYNEANGTEVPYHLAVIMDCPNELSDKAIKKLRSILENGPIAGINTIMVGTQEGITDATSQGKSQIIDLDTSCHVIDVDAPIQIVDINDPSQAQIIGTSPIEFFTLNQLNLLPIIEYVNTKITDRLAAQNEEE